MALIPDISDRKRREQQLQVLHRVLRHNLRNDLNMIYGNLTRLEDRLGPLRGLVEESGATGSPGNESETALTVEEIESALVPAVPDSLEYAGLLREKVDDLIDMTEKAQRAEAILRSVEDEHTAIDIETLLTDPLADLEPQYPDAEIEMAIGHNFDVLVNGPVGIAIRELAENAILHTELEEPAIELTAFKDGTRAYIEILDEGPGIPTEERKVLLLGEESAMLHSSGLGLWLANWLVNRSGGTLDFQEEDGGTTARIELPLAESTDSSD